VRSASITSMIRHYVARRAKVIEDHSHNAAYRAPTPACPTGAGSKVGLEMMPLANVTLSDGAARENARQPADMRGWLGYGSAASGGTDLADLRGPVAGR
jgi:hypothetical protein